MNAVNTNDPVEVTRASIKKVLKKYFKGPNASSRLEKATNDVMGEIVHMIKTTPGTNKKLGASVMTEAASAKNPTTGQHSVPPRIL